MPKRRLAIGTLLVLLLCGGLAFVFAGNVKKTYTQGVQGSVTVLRCSANEKDKCPHYTFTIIAKRANSTTISGQVRPGTNGVYKLELAAGTYQVTYNTNPETIAPIPKTVVIQARQYVDLNWSMSPPEGKPEPPKRPAGIPDPSTLKFQ